MANPLGEGGLVAVRSADTLSAAAETEQRKSALYSVTIVRMRHHQPTRDYVQRRTAEGLSQREIIRCPKRYIAHEIYNNLPRPIRAAPEIEPLQQAARQHRSIERGDNQRLHVGA